MAMAVAVALPATASADIFDLFSDDSLADGSRFAFAPSRSRPAIVAIDTQKRELAAEIEIPHTAGSVVASEGLDLLLATDPGSRSVTIVDLHTREVTARLDLGMRPDAALLNPFDRYVAFGSSSGVVVVWDMLERVEMLRVEGLETAEHMTFGVDGRNLYVVEPARKRISVIEMYERAKVAEIALGGDEDVAAEVSALSRSADGYTGYVSVTSENRVVVIDLLEWKVKRSVPVGAGPLRPYSTGDNRYVLVPNRDDETLSVLSALSHDVVATIPTGVRARELNAGWLDTVAFIMPAEDSHIGVVDLRELTRLDAIPVPGRTDDGLVTADSRTLLASLVDDGRVAVVDARRRELRTVIDSAAGTLEGIEIAISNNLCH